MDIYIREDDGKYIAAAAFGTNKWFRNQYNHQAELSRTESRIAVFVL